MKITRAIALLALPLTALSYMPLAVAQNGADDEPEDEAFEKPFVLDILKVNSDSNNRYHLPFCYHGQVMKVKFDYDSPESLAPLGESNGHQHLAVSLEDVAGRLRIFIASNIDSSDSRDHALKLGDRLYSWTGPYGYRVL